MTILDGKATAAKMRAEMANEISAARDMGLRAPALAVILAGEDQASRIYVRNKQRACEETGIVSLPFFLPTETSLGELIGLIENLNKRDDVDGILLQLPLPAGLDAAACMAAISPEKDVDGFHPLNVGRHSLGLPAFTPCTPAGVMELLKRYGLSVAGKKAVVIGRSDIVGKPLARLLSGKEGNATVTICHSGTPDLSRECKDADFLFLAMGRPGAIKGDMVKEGCVVVDIGINRTPDGLCGDADFESVAARAAAITPVPGGVGPMTIAMLLRNTLDSWKSRMKISSGGNTGARPEGGTDGKNVA